MKMMEIESVDKPRKNKVIRPKLGKEVHATKQQFTIMISGLNVEKHDVSLYLKFQGNCINILEITAVFIYDEKNQKPTVFSPFSHQTCPQYKFQFLKKKYFPGYWI